MTRQRGPSAPSSPPASSAPPPPPLPLPFIVDASAKHTHTIILLHGLGSNGEKFGKELLGAGVTSSAGSFGGKNLAQLMPNAKFIFPTSRRRRSSAFGRSLLTQWFDIARLPDPAYRKEIQLKGLAESAQDVLQILQQEQAEQHIRPEHIVLGGISQGCAMSLSLLLALPYSIGAFVGMSGYLPFEADLETEVDNAGGGDADDASFFAEDEDNDDDDNGDKDDPTVKATVFERDLLGLAPLGQPSKEQTASCTPIFLGHGSDDDKVPRSLGTAMASTVAKAGYKVTFKVYPGLGHWYKIPDEIDDIAGFLSRVISTR